MLKSTTPVKHDPGFLTLSIHPNRSIFRRYSGVILIYCPPDCREASFPTARKGGQRIGYDVQLVIHQVTPSLWPALEDLFGKGGACNGCWCMYWRIGSEYHRREREMNRSALHTLVKRGPSPGLLAFDGDRAVGWCQLTPRDELHWLHRARFFERVDDVPVWSVSCFYVRRGYRGKGVMSALIAAAVKEAKRARAPALEAYPVDAARPESTANTFTGTSAAFERAGFKTIALRLASRPIMRHDLKGNAG